MAHRVIRDCGLEIEGERCAPHSLCFEPEHAIRALWLQYNLLTPAKDFATDHQPLIFIWRNKPELDLRYGIWRGRMRYSAVVRDRFGVLKSLLPSCGPIIGTPLTAERT